MKRLSFLAVACAATLLLSGATSPPAMTHSDATVRLRFFSRRGVELPVSAVRKRMDNGGWDSDALIDPVTLEDLRGWPLYVDASGHLAFDLPDRPVAFEVNWPTRRGYSMVIADDGGAGFVEAGTVNFTYRAALDAKRRLDLEVAARPDYAPSPVFSDAYAAAAADLDTAAASTEPSVRGSYGQLALDQLAVANDLLLAEYGTRFAREGASTTPPRLGVTIDTIRHYRSVLDLASALTDPYGWVRVVMDPGTRFAEYAPVVDYAHSVGLKVMGEPIDSFYAKHLLGDRYLDRIQRAVTALPSVDSWEVGNEVNGGWLGPDMGERLDQAVSWLASAHPDAEVVITFYFQIGTDEPQWSLFNWIRDELRPSTIEGTDVLLLSTWIEDAPIGLAFDQVLSRLHELFPDQRVGIGELGYWAPGTSRVWWYGDRDPDRGRRIVLDQFYRAPLGYEWSQGGDFWWMFAEDMPADEVLACELSVVRDEVAGIVTPCP
jgi:hypothetical protein